MTAHRSQSTPTPAAAAIRQWTGTPAEWDAERDRLVEAMAKANEEFHARNGYALQSVSREWLLHLATIGMPPRPVEPPYTCEQCGVTDGDVYRFLGNYGHLTAESCREALKRELRALRDGPAPRYEVCGWGSSSKDGTLHNLWTNGFRSLSECEYEARRKAAEIGGTAHAIYRRVEGDK